MQQGQKAAAAAKQARRTAEQSRAAAAAWKEYVVAEGQEVQRGRGANGNPANRFEKFHVDLDPVEPGDEEDERPARRTQFLHDATKTIIASNNSPDVCFERSINPY